MNKSNIKQNNASRKVLQKSQEVTFPYTIDAFGIPILVFKNVFSPKHFNGWEIFTKNFPPIKNKNILEIGAGTGVTSIYLAKNGARHVVAADINPYAVKNIQANVKLNKLKNISALKSDIYSKITEGQLFDYIYWNMPFMPIKYGYKYRSVLERGLFDPGYKITDSFIRNAKKHLNKNGKILIGWGGKNFGDVKKLKELAKKYDYKIKLLAKQSSTEINPVEFLLYELNQIK